MNRKARRTAKRNKQGAENLAGQLGIIADNMATSFGAMVDQVKAEARDGGEHGVMIIATDSAHVCKAVPFGKIYQAGSQEAHDKRLAELEDM